MAFWRSFSKEPPFFYETLKHCCFSFFVLSLFFSSHSIDFSLSCVIPIWSASLRSIAAAQMSLLTPDPYFPLLTCLHRYIKLILSKTIQYFFIKPIFSGIPYLTHSFRQIGNFHYVKNLSLLPSSIQLVSLIHLDNRKPLSYLLPPFCPPSLLLFKPSISLGLLKWSLNHYPSLQHCLATNNPVLCWRDFYSMQI